MSRGYWWRKKFRVVAVVQARLHSRRLFRKVLSTMPDGRPLLVHVLERVRAAGCLDAVVLAIPACDAELSRVVSQFFGSGSYVSTPIHVLRVQASEEDVLSRFVQAIEEYRVDLVVRVTGDCPLFDPGVVPQLVDMVANYGYIYASNTYPGVDGLDCEVFHAETFLKEWEESVWAKDCPGSRYHREHVTSWFRNRPSHDLGHLSYFVEHQGLKLSVDTPEDFDLVSRISSRIPPQHFSFLDTLQAYELVKES